MKAKEEIRIRNYRGFDENGLLKKGEQSSFKVLKGEDFKSKLEEKGLTEQEVLDISTRILKGNSQWLELETKEEKVKLKEVKEEKKVDDLRYEELRSLKKKEQVSLLKELGAKDIPAYEDERVKLIMKMEKN
jgi:hypothetical protein